MKADTKQCISSSEMAPGKKQKQYSDYKPRNVETDKQIATWFCATLQALYKEWAAIKKPGKIRIVTIEKLKEVRHRLNETAKIDQQLQNFSRNEIDKLSNNSEMIEGVLEIMRYIKAGGHPMSDPVATVEAIMRENLHLDFKKLRQGFRDIGRSQHVQGGVAERHNLNRGTYTIEIYDILNPLRTEDGKKLEDAINMEKPIMELKLTGPLPAFVLDQVRPYMRLLTLLKKHTGSGSETGSVHGAGSKQDYRSTVAMVDVLLLHDVMMVAPFRTGEGTTHAFAPMMYVKLIDDEQKIAAVPLFARSIDLMMGSWEPLDDTKPMIVHVVNVNAKPKQNVKKVNHTGTRFFELPNKLRGMGEGMFELCLALKGVGHSAEPQLRLIGKDASSITKHSTGVGCVMTPYGARYRHAIEAKARVERGIITEKEAIKPFGHLSEDMINKVYAEPDHSEPAPPFTVHDHVPDTQNHLIDSRKCMRELNEAEAQRNGGAYPRDKFATKTAIELALFATRRMITELKDIGATVNELVSRGAPNDDIVHAMIAEDAARFYGDIYGLHESEYNEEEKAKMTQHLDGLRPTSWQQLLGILETCPPVVDVGMVDFGQTPKEVVDEIGRTFVAPPPFHLVKEGDA